MNLFVDYYADNIFVTYQVLLNTRCSADAKFIAFVELEDPIGKNEWTMVKQLYNSNGLMPGANAATAGGSGANNVPMYSGAGAEYDYLDYVESKIIKLEVFTDGGSYEDAKARVKKDGYEASVSVERGERAKGSSGKKPNAYSPEKVKNQFDALELRAHDEKFSMYDGKFELGAKPDLSWLLAKVDNKPGVKTTSDLIVVPYQINGKTTWFAGEYGGDAGYNPNLDYQPFIPLLEGTDMSANSRFLLYLQEDDPIGTKEWTRITQYFGQRGLLEIKMDKKYKTGVRDKVKKFKPWEQYEIEEFVDFEKFVLTVNGRVKGA